MAQVMHVAVRLMAFGSRKTVNVLAEGGSPEWSTASPVKYSCSTAAGDRWQCGEDGGLLQRCLVCLPHQTGAHLVHRAYPQAAPGQEGCAGAVVQAPPSSLARNAMSAPCHASVPTID